ncbi:NUDIX domain-containing protein [Mycobacterium sp. 236(2023)]|uniref:NUDIX domain-containing protein n=1 Tax=Mycobacterium sp. 236(2023) TaxID=3038163 RepID=UPI002414EB00|nr:NUDIX domain-containing protein [Mycobacterium sp. 236(2023)]MDG4667515.1 NUDIX domain-containing protein [Mycobacterium sp. 236(2023)]
MSALPLRDSCRALLVDGDRILLAQHRIDDEYTVWTGPGGGVEEGETLVQALARELYEETGLVLTDDHAPRLVWIQTASLAWMRAHGFEGIVNHFFLIHVDTFTPASALEPGAAGHPDTEGILEQRWWSLADIDADRANGVLFSPRALPKLLQELLTDGPPATPLALGL